MNTQDPRIKTLIEDIVDPEDRSVVENLLSTQYVGELYESSSPEEQRIANAVTKKIEGFWKATAVVAYIDIRRQIKATQREVADLRKQVDKISKKSDALPEMAKEISEIRKGIEAILVVPHGFNFKNVKQTQKDRINSQDESFTLIKKIASKIGV